MKNVIVCMMILAFPGLYLPGCSMLQEAVYGRQSKLEPLSSAVLGSTPRDEIIKRYGPPEEIDRRWFDSQESEVYFYHEQYPNQNSQLEYQFLACEFSKGILTAYSFHDSVETSQQGFDENERFKLVKGKSSRRDVQNLLGHPKGKALLPTTITLPALAIRLGGAPFPMAVIPGDAREVWLYYSQNLDDYLNKSAQKTLSVFFDGNGLFIGSMLMQELASKTR